MSKSQDSRGKQTQSDLNDKEKSDTKENDLEEPNDEKEIDIPLVDLTENIFDLA